jgi:GTP-binding protein
MTQAKTRPPGFVVMCSYPDKIAESYSRYLVNGLREDFDMPGHADPAVDARAGRSEPL